MPRTIEATLPADLTDAALNRLKNVDGVTGLAIHRGASLQPPGDIIVAQTTNDAARAVLEMLAEHGGAGPGGSIQSTEPRARISGTSQNGMERESNETIWEEDGLSVAARHQPELQLSAADAARRICGGGWAVD